MKADYTISSYHTESIKSQEDEANLKLQIISSIELTEMGRVMYRISPIM